MLIYINTMLAVSLHLHTFDVVVLMRVRILRHKCILPSCIGTDPTKRGKSGIARFARKVVKMRHFQRICQHCVSIEHETGLHFRR